MKKWSDETRKKRLNWFGKVMRMNENTPAKLALRYALEKYKRPKGKPPTTWIYTIKKDLDEINLNWEIASEIAKDEKQWKDVIMRIQ